MIPKKYNRRVYYIPPANERYVCEVIDRGFFEITVKGEGLPVPTLIIPVPHNSFDVGDTVVIEKRTGTSGLTYRYVGRKEE